MNLDLCAVAFALKGRKTLLTWVYASGNLNHYYRNIVMESGKGIAGRVHQSGKVLVIQNVDEELTEERQISFPITIVEGLKSLMAVPLWGEGKCEGVLLLAFREPDQITTELFEEAMSRITPSFCDFEVKYSVIGDAVGVEQAANFEAVPIYELMNYSVLQAREDERKRIAKDLHDSAVQNVLGVQFLVRTAKRAKDREKMMELLGQADELLSDIQDELRSLATSLRPASLDDLGLVASLNSYFSRMENVYSVKIHLRQNIGLTRYSANTEIAIFRVCQEAVRNSCKYSKCASIEVTLLDSKRFLSMRVKDDGVGYDTKNPDIRGGGMGMVNMKEWISLLDGEFSVNSVIGKGTTIEVSVPIISK